MEVLTALKQRVIDFRATLPLIMGLRSDAMRPRHWNQLMEEIGKTFDVNADDFTLSRVFDLRPSTPTSSAS